MKVARQAKEIATGGAKVCATIGMFDGVHLGHQQVIRQTVHDAEQQEALSLAITFDRHPASVIAPKRAPRLIYGLDQRLQAIAAQGIDTTLLLTFDEAFSQIRAEAFIRGLAEDLGRIHSVAVGSNFAFGYRREGNVALLQTLGEELGFQVHSVPSVSLNGQPVSSTRIREAIRQNAFDAATQMLGRPYKLAGRVVPGDRVATQLGFPTANLDTTGLVLPSNGIYAAHAEIDSRIYRAVINIGYRPTLHQPSEEPLVEAHLLNFSEDLYETELAIHFVAKLREETAFDSVEELVRQIQKDIAAAEKLFA